MSDVLSVKKMHARKHYGTVSIRLRKWSTSLMSESWTVRWCADLIQYIPTLRSTLQRWADADVSSCEYFPIPWIYSLFEEDDPVFELVVIHSWYRANSGKMTKISFGNDVSEVTNHYVFRTSSNSHVLYSVDISSCKRCHHANASLYLIIKIVRIVSTVTLILVRINESIKYCQN